LDAVDPQPVEETVIGPPVAADADREVEVDACSEHPLDLLAGSRADRLDHAAARPDQDALLGVGLDPDEGADAVEIVVGELERLEDDTDRMRNLLKRPPENLLTDQLGEHLIEWDVRVLVGLIEERPGREETDEVGDELRHPGAGAGRDREDLGLTR